ncbi:MAG TPA: hypothetical protein VF690_14335, partial [Hymenobacter sp.]
MVSLVCRLAQVPPELSSFPPTNGAGRRTRRRGGWGLGALLGWLLVGASAALAQPGAALPRAVVVDTLAHDDSHRMEVAYTTLSGISGQVRDVFDSRSVAEALPSVEENLHAIRHSVEENGQVVDIKQLQMCRLMLLNIQEQLGKWRTALGGAHEQLEEMQARLAGLAPSPTRRATPDATARALQRADSALQRRQQRIGQLLTKRFERTKQLQTQVAASYIQALELQDVVGDQQRRFNRAIVEATYPPLWAARPSPAAPVDPEEAHHAEAYRHKIIAYYFADNWDNWAYMFLIGLGFYAW